MGTDLNFRSGYLLPGMALGNLPLNVTLAADNTVIQVNYCPHIRITTDNATSTNRTFSLTSGSWHGQELFITVVGSSTNRCELVSTGNVSLVGGTWTATVGETIHLIWDSLPTTPVWREISRSQPAGRYTPTWAMGANAVSASALSCLYSRVGNIVTVSGSTAVVTTAAAATLTVITATLPIASNLGAAADLSGSGLVLAATGTDTAGVGISANTGSDLASFSWNSTQTTSALLTFTFQYEVI